MSLTPPFSKDAAFGVDSWASELPASIILKENFLYLSHDVKAWMGSELRYATSLVARWVASSRTTVAPLTHPRPTSTSCSSNHSLTSSSTLKHGRHICDDKLLHQSASGILLSYTWLIQHLRDFDLAVENQPLSPVVAWKLFAVFAYVTGLLSAMRVGLATQQLQHSAAFNQTAFRFAVISMFATGCVILAFVGFWLVLFGHSLWTTLWFARSLGREGKRKEQDKWRENGKDTRQSARIPHSVQSVSRPSTPLDSSRRRFVIRSRRWKMSKEFHGSCSTSHILEQDTHRTGEHAASESLWWTCLSKTFIGLIERLACSSLL
ncbi:hypothetical protein BJ875DRAFT_540120 [Amylocarpus encephaloides]|uniref:Uncharacterized protein n=1 Tax=Amylocarpus encephaloides TaxID=45428 RepID=A0A9P7YRQ2_9HELO|nr:hypothetical protein BJ875DRAFT_540120 [Amylocarpus encephaloides]